MKKTISYTQFQSVKAIAKACNDPMRRKAATLEKIKKLQEECSEYDNQIESIGAGIFQMTGHHVSEWVKRIEEPTGKINAKTGKPITSVKFLPSDLVSYDETTRQYTLSIPDEEEATPTTANVGSDYDLDKENFQQDAIEEAEPEEAAEDNDMDDIFG